MFSLHPRIVMLCGLPGSGKSTIARKLCDMYLATSYMMHINMDTIRREQSHLPKPKQWDVSYQQLRTALKLGQSVVIDNTNFLYRLRAPYMEIVRKFGIDYEVDCIVLDKSIETCLRQNARRKGNELVPENVIRNMYDLFQRPKMTEGFDRIFYIGDSDEV